jgi:lipid A ethanolaminephosphotransferase
MTPTAPDLAPADAIVRRPWHPLSLLLVLALWLSTLGNLPLWRAMWALTDTHGQRTWLGLVGFALIVLSATTVLLSLLVWPRWRKPAGVLLLMVAAANSYFMIAYGVVIDPTMMANTVQTDVREVRDLLSWSMLVVLALGVALPGWWWWRQPVQKLPAWGLAGRQLGLAALATLFMLVVVWASFQDLASTMRNEKSMRYMLNPFNTLYASARLVMGQTTQASMPLQPIGEDAVLARALGVAQQPPLIVLVVGETARAANFGLGGYARDTTPLLRQLQGAGELAYFSNVSSCGTNTQVSVPCMFSHLGREANAKNDIPYENLLDVLQRAGMQVLWLDNQSGCKGVCDRVPNANTSALKDPALCPNGECFDEIMLRVLPERLAQLEKSSASGKAAGTVVVLHQMGNHGPAYYRRTPADMKVYQPECRSTVLQDCPAQDIVNAYDNAVRYTDLLLAQTVGWLKGQARPTAMLYVADHGESLGEKGLYLHGMPYLMAPKEQTHVPMVMWLSKPLQSQLQWDAHCWKKQAYAPISHDHLFHSVLTLAQVKTRWQKPELDIFAGCAARSP